MRDDPLNKSRTLKAASRAIRQPFSARRVRSSSEPVPFSTVCGFAGRNLAAKPQTVEKGTGSLDDLTRLALKGCLIARDAAFNVRDLFNGSSRMAFLALKDCAMEHVLIDR